MSVVSISGSPSSASRSAWLLQLVRERLGPVFGGHRTVAVRELPAQALMAGDAKNPALQAAIEATAAAQLLIVATPIYKAAYSGLLKLFLDVLPQDSLRGKRVLPIATGGSLAHLLALDYALKPVLSALGARDILDGVFATDAQLEPRSGGGYLPDDELLTRLERALLPLGVGARLPTGPDPAETKVAARC